MTVDNFDLKNNLKIFGLNDKEVEVYLTLVTHDWMTALQLSRKCSVKRTTLYRILESLLVMGLVEEKIDDKTTLYAATPGDSLDNLIRERENETKRMREIVPDITSHIRLLHLVRPLEVGVRFFRGVRGLQYLNLKQTTSKDKEVLIIDSDQWDSILSREFAEEVRARHVKNGVVVREIANRHSEDNSWTDNLEYLQHHYQYRVLPKEVLNITQDIYVYDDTIQYSGYSQSDLVGIEIINREYATMMKQMFEMLWKMGKKK